MMWGGPWKLNSLDLSTVALHVGVVDLLGGPSFRDPGITVVGRDGVVDDPLAPLGPWTFTLRVVYKWEDQSGVDGVVGGRNLVLRELYKTPTLYASVPRWGAVSAPVKLVADPQPGSERNEWLYMLRSPYGGFKDVSETSQTGTPPTAVTSGVKPIHDPVLIFSAAGTYELTWGNGRKFTVVASAGPTYPVTVDVGAGTIVDDAAADASGDVSFSDPAWLILEAGATLSHTATSEVTLKWRNLW